MEKIAVIGTGYVGLVTGACLADLGNNVTCVDIDAGKIERLQKGIMPIYEPGLEELVKSNTRTKRLRFTTELANSIKENRVIFIAVGTPSKEDGSADLSYVNKVAEEIGKNLNGFKVIVTKSTVPVGTGKVIKNIIEQFAKNKVDYSVVSNPEFLREGSAIKDFLQPDRIVVGTDNLKALEIIKKIYEPLLLQNVPLVTTNIETAELIKYASNAFLAARITFVNELTELCESFGADIMQIVRGMGLDRRIGLHYLHPGPGYGGSCFPKDTKALIGIARSNGIKLELIEAIDKANERIKKRAIAKVTNILKRNPSFKTVAVLGLSFKAGTDDMREAISIPLIRELHLKGVAVKAYDPAAMEMANRVLNIPIKYCNNVYQALENADLAVITTEWNEFKALDFSRLKKVMNNPIIVDLRNLYDPYNMADLDIEYHSLGRKTVWRKTTRITKE